MSGLELRDDWRVKRVLFWPIAVAGVALGVVAYEVQIGSLPTTPLRSWGTVVGRLPICTS